jgi:hypothetical protein
VVERLGAMNLAEIANAIEKNGLEQIKGSYFETNDKGSYIGACAQGMACLNLQITVGQLEEYLYQIDDSLSGDIIALNDDNRLSFQEIANWIRSKYYHKLYSPLIDE